MMALKAQLSTISDFELSKYANLPSREKKVEKPYPDI